MKTNNNIQGVLNLDIDNISSNYNTSNSSVYSSSISSSYIPSPLFIYVTEENNKEELKDLIELSGDTEESNYLIEQDVYAQFALFFPNVKSILVPKKSEYNLKNYVPKNLLREVDANLDIAIEKCLVFLSNLSSTYYIESENKYKKLSSTILHEQTKGKDNTYIYTKIIKALLVGTKKTGAIIEVKKNNNGEDTYEVGVSSKQYKLTDTYLRAGLVEYIIKDSELIQKRNKSFYKQLKEANKNIICKNLIELYADIDIPTKEEMIARAKVLIKEGYMTKKGKKLTMRNKHKNEYWSDVSERSFAEDSIALFNFLTNRGYMIPTAGDIKSGGRVVDSFTLMPSWIREMCTINGAPIEEADYSCLHPNIAINEYEGNTEYITHKKVAENTSIDEKEIKIEHLSFLNKTWKQMCKSPLFDYYAKTEPLMMENIYKEKEKYGHKETSRRMFKVEVDIMTEVIRRLNAEGIYVGYVYDALFTTKDNKQRVVEVMNKVSLLFGVKTKAK